MPERTFGAISLETSNEDKVFFPGDGLSKGDLIDYYVNAAEHILPLIKNRPLTLFRWPDGIERDGFVQQQVQDHFPDWIPSVTVERRGKGGDVTHPLAEKAADLAFFANQGTVTLHAWLSRWDKPDTPDTLVFDLDPPESSGFDLVRQGARDVRELLEELGLAAYVKATGSKGLHVLAPLRREHGFDEVRKFVRNAADLLAARNPKDYTTEQYKKDRGDRLYLDTARNAYGQTIVAAYAVRAKPGAPVACPLDLDELGDSAIGPRSFTVNNVFRRLGQKQDPWAGMFRHARGLDRPIKKLGKLLHEAGMVTDQFYA